MRSMLIFGHMVRSKVQYTPIVTTHYKQWGDLNWGVYVQAIRVFNVSIAISAAALNAGGAMVDDGTSALLLPVVSIQ